MRRGVTLSHGGVSECFCVLYVRQCVHRLWVCVWWCVWREWRVESGVLCGPEVRLRDLYLYFTGYSQNKHTDFILAVEPRGQARACPTQICALSVYDRWGVSCLALSRRVRG